MATSQPSVSETSQLSELPRVISLFSATMLGVGAMIGAGIFVLSGIAAGEAGPALILAFALNGLVAFAIGACYAELASAMPRAGGSYYWVQQAMGPRVGFFAGWISLYANAVAAALYALGFGAFSVALLLPEGWSWSVLRPDTVLAVLLTGIITLVHSRGASETTRVENAVTLLKIVLLLGLILAGLHVLAGKPHPLAAYQPWLPKGWGGLVMAMAITFVAFEGFEVITRTGEEIVNPARNIPRAIFLSIALAVSLYLGVAVVMLGAVEAPAGMPVYVYLGQLGELGMATAAGQMFPRGELVFFLAGMVSTASAMIAATFSAIRVTFAMARGGDMPQAAMRLHGQYHSPAVAAALVGVLIALMVVALPIKEVASGASMMFAVLFSLVCLATICLRQRHPAQERPYRVPGSPLVPGIGVLAGLVVLVVLWDVSPMAWSASVAWLSLGWLMHQVMHRRRRRG